MQRKWFCGACGRWRPAWRVDYKYRSPEICRDCLSKMQDDNEKVIPKVAAPQTVESSQHLGRRLDHYRLTRFQYQKMLRDQGNACAICKRPMPDALDYCVDHNHATGAVRGLLCAGCNSGLGFLGDSPENLRRAAVYLEERGFYGEMTGL